MTFEEVHYSVPHPVAFAPVTLKAYLEQVVLVHQGQVVARHRRSRTPGEHVLDPKHFLEVLSRKPAYLEKTRLFAEMKLPEVFGRLREQLRTQWGEREGKRQYIQTLQLLASHDQQRLAEAVEACLGTRQLRAAAIQTRLQSGEAAIVSNHPVDVAVPMPDLGRFDQLLQGPHPHSEGV